MIILPAIDIKDGKCVRLYKGRFDTVSQVAENAVETAKKFKEQGALFLHMVDLDGSLEKKQVNRDIFIATAKESGLFTELGGGIRHMKTISDYIENGISRVILGSAALKDPQLVKDAVKEYGDKIAVGIDAKNGMVCTEGWLSVSETTYIELAKVMEQIGVDNIIYTNIDHDGTLEGPDLDGLKKLSEAVCCKITASGGIRDIENIKALEKLGLYGAICGKSIYSGTLDLTQACKVAGCYPTMF